MNSRDRVYTAIRHEEPDKIPKGEIGVGIGDELIRQLLGNIYRDEVDHAARFVNQRKVRELLSIDLVSPELSKPVPYKIDIDAQRRDILKDPVWGDEFIKTNVGAPKTHKSLLSSVKEIYSYEPPTSQIFSAEIIKRWVEETDLFVFYLAPGILTISYHKLFNFEKFMILCRTNTESIKVLMRKLVGINIECAKLAIEAGAHGVMIADDLGFNSGLFISPKLLRELYFPYLEEEVYQIKKLEVPIFLHSDGDIRKILPDIVSIGFDGWQAVQAPPGIGYSEYMREIKQKYGDKLCLMGNISIDLLGRGSPEEIKEETKKLIKIAAHGGGFIFSSSNELGLETKPENAIAMYCAAEKYGVYPIKHEQ